MKNIFNWLMRNQARPIFPLPLSPPRAHEHSIAELTKKFNQDLQTQFLGTSHKHIYQHITSKPESHWLRAGEERAVKLFQAAAQRVPAYKDFLKKNRVNTGKIKTIADFKKIPWIDKTNYLQQYPLSALSWDGNTQVSQIISVSSGSSGKPFFWPRGRLLEMESAFMHELILAAIFGADTKKTLFINAFTMGMYVAGPITLDSVMSSARKGHPIITITPGLDIDDVIKAVKNLNEHFDQIVLAGYPPFLKDIISVGIEQGVNWAEKNIRFLLAGEGFNESWRDYVAELTEQSDIFHSFINVYGSADAAALGHESPTSIAIRRQAASNANAFTQLFPEEKNGRLPTLVQYYPTHKYFEAIDNELIFTATAGIPLIRYNIHDFGGTMSLADALGRVGLSMADVQKASGSPVWQLPFVYLYGKSDHTVTLYGLNIYPENIKFALEKSRIRDKVTGRFTMSTEYEKDTQNQFVSIRIELNKKVQTTKEVQAEIEQEIVQVLLEVNAEYNKLCDSIGRERAAPQITLIPNGNSELFKYGIKHHWVIT